MTCYRPHPWSVCLPTLPSSLSSRLSILALSVYSFTLTTGRGVLVVKSPCVSHLKPSNISLITLSQPLITITGKINYRHMQFLTLLKFAYKFCLKLTLAVYNHATLLVLTLVLMLLPDQSVVYRLPLLPWYNTQSCWRLMTWYLGLPSLPPVTTKTKHG